MSSADKYKRILHPLHIFPPTVLFMVIFFQQVNSSTLAKIMLIFTVVTAVDTVDFPLFIYFYLHTACFQASLLCVIL